MGRPAWEGSADERWQPEVGSAFQVDSCSATGQEMGGGGKVRRERKAASTGERRGYKRDRYRGEKKRNE